MTMVSSAYRNGNYLVVWNNNRDMEKRCFRRGEDFMPEFPDSIDLKISDRCGCMCPYCHESSSPEGKLANPDLLFQHLDLLPSVPIEVAIGGGDVLLDTKLLSSVVEYCKTKNFQPRVTVNEASIQGEEHIEYLNSLGIPVGISLRPATTKGRLEEVINLLSIAWGFENRVVFHIILGACNLDLLDVLIDNRPPFYSTRRILFLGFKDYGRALENGIVAKDLDKFEARIKELVIKQRTTQRIFCNCRFGFDNLALEQINIRSALLEDEFDDIYLGPEFSCSMYVDGVKGEYSKTSRSEERVSWDEIGIIDFFKNDKIKK